ncbi:hypothetical protein JANAI62_03430 [Jannaschia pagri]|uniref:Uncharacterized protein n=1 Tax=Jannaschia pagri TaxID=2829797 RepID=A0ABQ4NHR2_9RHOB|nr:hypothetical protein JANAI61_06320 [Jannaschia sp. AI_61]GIT93720.1 hypothetical protein JANAI62_03430 [Jannaschia sp. AI_62]
MKKYVVKSVSVIGIGQWKYEYKNIPDAIAGVHGLYDDVLAGHPRMDFIEVMVEFTGGAFERCCYETEERVIWWLSRFEDVVEI